MKIQENRAKDASYKFVFYLGFLVIGLAAGGSFWVGHHADGLMMAGGAIFLLDLAILGIPVFGVGTGGKKSLDPYLIVGAVLLAAGAALRAFGFQ